MDLNIREDLSIHSTKSKYFLFTSLKNISDRCQTMEANSIIAQENNKNLKKIGIFSDIDERENQIIEIKDK